MMNTLMIDLEDLISARLVESTRREFKGGWSDYTIEQTTRTVCAFANDLFNLNGGYIIIGIDEENGLPVLPPRGLDGDNIDKIQKAIHGNCKRIDPEYQPLFSPEVYQDRQILVIWAPGGEQRPYKAPKTIRGKSTDKAYYVRIEAETVEAQGPILNQLLEMAAKVAFDDRKNMTTPIEKISPTLVRNFLSDIKSDWVSPGVTVADRDLFRYMDITAPINSHEVPKNIGLLFLQMNQLNISKGI